MTAKHTPGPWHAYPADYQREHAGDLLPIFVVGPREFHTVAQVRAGNEDDDLPTQTRANARLIAAAPDMLAALRRIVQRAYESETDETGLRDTIHALHTLAVEAIAMAEGRG